MIGKSRLFVVGSFAAMTLGATMLTGCASEVDDEEPEALAIDEELKAEPGTVLRNEDSGYCLMAFPLNKSRAITQGRCRGIDNQKFVFKNGRMRVRSTGYCVTRVGAAKSGAALEQRPCSASLASQQRFDYGEFWFKPGHPGTYSLPAKDGYNGLLKTPEGLCINTADQSAQGKVELADCNLDATSNSRWTRSNELFCGPGGPYYGSLPPNFVVPWYVEAPERAYVNNQEAPRICLDSSTGRFMRFGPCDQFQSKDLCEDKKDDFVAGR